MNEFITFLPTEDGDLFLEVAGKIRQQKERVSGCGMQKQASYVSSFLFHLSLLSFPFANPFLTTSSKVHEHTGFEVLFR
jgi:hypothetical protein